MIPPAGPGAAAHVASVPADPLARRDSRSEGTDVCENEENAKRGRPGDEVSDVLEGTVTVEIEGAPARTLRAGEMFFVPAGKVHAATAGGRTAIVIANSLVEKGKPLTAAVP